MAMRSLTHRLNKAEVRANPEQGDPLIILGPDEPDHFTGRDQTLHRYPGEAVEQFIERAKLWAKRNGHIVLDGV